MRLFRKPLSENANIVSAYKIFKGATIFSMVTLSITTLRILDKNDEQNIYVLLSVTNSLLFRVELR
jgi:hypothetical protein